MEMLILAAVAAFFVKNAFVDTAAMVTGKTPPSHSYRMAKLKAEAAKERRKAEADADQRGGMGMVFRHWYLDACEDLDHWRANRHYSKPERKAAARARREERLWRMREWAAQYVPEEEETVDEQDDFEPRRAPNPNPNPEPESEPEEPRWRRRHKRTTTTEEEEFEVIELSDEVTVLPFGHQDEGERLPLPHRRMVLATMIADIGREPDWEIIGQMESDQVDEAISGLIALRRGERTA